MNQFHEGDIFMAKKPAYGLTNGGYLGKFPVVYVVVRVYPSGGIKLLTTDRMGTRSDYINA